MDFAENTINAALNFVILSQVRSSAGVRDEEGRSAHLPGRRGSRRQGEAVPSGRSHHQHVCPSTMRGRCHDIVLRNSSKQFTKARGLGLKKEAMKASKV